MHCQITRKKWLPNWIDSRVASKKSRRTITGIYFCWANPLAKGKTDCFVNENFVFVWTLITSEHWKCCKESIENVVFDDIECRI